MDNACVGAAAKLYDDAGWQRWKKGCAVAVVMDDSWVGLEIGAEICEGSEEGTDHAGEKECGFALVAAENSIPHVEW